MATNTTPPLFFAQKVRCSFFGHRFITSRNITNHFKEYKCSVCHLEMTNDVNGMWTFLTPELRDVNETLNQFFQKKHHLA